METKEWTFPDKVDRAPWGKGPWDGEPDKMQWPDPATGLACLTVRTPSGHWCGYVGVGKAHPWYEVGYNECIRLDFCDTGGGWCDHRPEYMVSVHGGLTYSDLCAEQDPERGVCHTAGLGEEEPLWWFGFDTAHAGDLSPEWRAYGVALGGEYRDLGYVREQCTALAQQLRGVA